MKRRQFLGSAAAGALMLPALSIAGYAAPAIAPLTAIRLLGERFVEATRCLASGCEHATLRVRILGMRPAPGRPVLDALRLDAMFDTPTASGVRFHAWEWRAAAGATSPVGFAAGRAAMRSLSASVRRHGQADWIGASLALGSAGSSLLEPGRYVLVSERRDGGAVDPVRLRASGDPASPVADAGRDFDYVVVTVG
jgi:hypothetical protein